MTGQQNPLGCADLDPKQWRKLMRKFVMIAPLALALASCGGEKAEQAKPEPASTDFVAESPTDPAVPVDLPSTALTNAPASEAAPAKQ